MVAIALCLSGCGVFDGSEIHESVLTLLAIEKAGCTYQCFAPDRTQRKVVNHLTQQDVAGETRNCLQEAARIARGDVLPLQALNIKQFDAVIFPGGFGAALNLCDFALAGAHQTVQDDVLSFARAFAKAKKPMGFLCIAPVLIPAIIEDTVSVTIGNDTEVAAALEAMGCDHQQASVDEIIIDKAHKVVTTPAYMLGTSLLAVAQGIEQCVNAVVALTTE